jgi:plastocyanin
MKRKFLMFVLAGLALAAAACSSQPAAPAEPVSFRIEMSEYAFSPAEIEVKVGQQVTLELVNNGALVHELMIGRDVLLMENRPSGYQVDLFQSAGVEPEILVMDAEAVAGEHGDAHDESHTGFMVVLPENGGSASMTFTVTKDMVGEWEMGCFEQEGVHYTAGMKGKLVVKP